jgi:tetratricopeptide (TPR) repeat protein
MRDRVTTVSSARRRRVGAARAWAAVVLVTSAVASSACSGRGVVRLVDGVPVAHRFIPARAYAAYARGIHAEAEAHYPDAIAAFTESAQADSDGVEPRVRLGAALCHERRFEDAKSAFRDAEERDPAFEPLWRERAICAVARSDLAEAKRDIAQAELFDPDRDETVLLRAEILERGGDGAAALRELVGLTTRRPTTRGFEAQLRVAEALGDEPAARLARVALSLHPDVSAPKHPSRRERLTLVDHLLDAGDVRGAVREGRAAHLSPAEVILRAAMMARPDVAEPEALRVLGADPSDGDALVATLLAADLGRDAATFERALDRARGIALRPISPLAVAALLEVLQRRAGVSLAAPSGSDPEDPLTSGSRARAGSTPERSP